MALQKREKILGIATGSLLVVFGLFWLLGGESIGDLETKRDGLAKRVRMQEAKARPGIRAREQLTAWQSRALPSNVTLARSLYSKWLLELVVDRVEFDNASVTPGGEQRHGKIYAKLSFDVQGEATLEQLTKFLHEFYSVGHLHKIARLTIKPIEDSSQLTVSMLIEALSMPEADRKDELTGQPAERLVRENYDAYRETIVRRRMEEDRYVDGRGLFASYQPPPPPPAPPRDDPPPRPPDPPRPEPPRFDNSKHTYITGMAEVDGKAQAWLEIRPTGETKVLHEGDAFEIGTVKGKVTGIGLYAIEIEVDGHSYPMGFDISLHEATDDSEL